MNPSNQISYRPDGRWDRFLSRWIFSFDRNAPLTALTGRVVLWAVLLAWGANIATSPIQEGWNSVIHYINLPIHETGHLLFTPFGRLMHFLGGTIFQILMPLIIMGAFLIKKRDSLAAAVCLWWAGQNCIDSASYIYDARAKTANLVGGGTHDWAWILGRLGRMSQDHEIARTVFAIGVMIMLAAILWGGFVLWMQFQWIRYQKDIQNRQVESGHVQSFGI